MKKCKPVILIAAIAAFFCLGGCSVLTTIGEKIGVIKPEEQVEVISSQPFADEQVVEQVSADLDGDGKPETVFVIAIMEQDGDIQIVNDRKNNIYVHDETQGYFIPEIINDQKYDLDDVLYHSLWAQEIPEYEGDTPTNRESTDVTAEITYSAEEPLSAPGAIISYRDGSFLLFIIAGQADPSASPGASASPRASASASASPGSSPSAAPSPSPSESPSASPSEPAEGSAGASPAASADASPEASPGESAEASADET